MQPKDKIQTIYVPYQNRDVTFGGGPMVPFPCNFGFSDRATAEAYIDSQSGIMDRCVRWSGEEDGDWAIRELPVYSSLEEEKTDRKRLIRERILKDLSEEERDALDL